MFDLTLWTKARLTAYALVALLVTILIQVIGPLPEAGPTPTQERKLPTLIDNLAHRGSGR